MAINYTKFAALALKLITANGRDLTITLRPRTPADATKPWDGPNVAASTSVIVKGVLGQDMQSDPKGDLVRDGNEVAYIAAAATDPAFVEDYDVLTDGTQSWKIASVEIVAPGNTRVLYILKLRN